MRLFTLSSLIVLFALTACTKDNSLLPATATLSAGPDETHFAEIAVAEAEATAEREDHLAAFGAKNHRTYIEAGSSNALSAAIAQTSAGGTITLASGDHTQSGTLTISKRINIQGEKGARLLISGTTPLGVGPRIEAGVHILKTEFVRLRNFELVPVGGEGATAILVQESPYTFISRIVAKDWQNGVIAEQSQKLYVERSEFIGSSQWQTDPNFPVFGIVVVNGPNATIFNNTIRNTVFGVWACDKRGRLSYNQLSGNVNGIELCKVPVSFPLPNGEVVGSEFSATGWLVFQNNSSNNFNNGFEVIDGANRCLLVSNVATDNAVLDYEFAGRTERYGFVAPTSANNYARLQGGSRWADCGSGNSVYRGEEIEDWTCF